MLIVEGPDGSGKTTLAQRLAKEFGLEYRRGPALSSTTGATIERYHWWQEQVKLDNERHRGVYDRCWWISEPIYQMVQGTRNLLVPGPEMSDGIDQLWLTGPLMIFCLPPWEVAQINIRSRPRLAGVDDRALEKVHWLYHTFYAMWYQADAGNTVRWDYTTDTDEGLWGQINNYLESLVAHGSV